MTSRTAHGDSWARGSAAAEAETVFLALLAASLVLLLMAATVDRLRKLSGPGGAGVELSPLSIEDESDVAAAVAAQLQRQDLINDPEAARTAWREAFAVARREVAADRALLRPEAMEAEPSAPGSGSNADRPWKRVAEYAAKKGVDVAANFVAERASHQPQPPERDVRPRDLSSSKAESRRDSERATSGPPAVPRSPAPSFTDPDPSAPLGEGEDMRVSTDAALAEETSHDDASHAVQQREMPGVDAGDETTPRVDGDAPSEDVETSQGRPEEPER